MASGISVIIPVHNGERYLGEALSSALGQTLLPDDILVVDDGSTDHTVDIVRDFPSVRCMSQLRAGQAQAINAGVSATDGPLLAFLDADDRWLPEKLERQSEVLSKCPELDIVFGYARQFIEPGLTTTANPVNRNLPARLPSSMLLRRSASVRVGGFSGQWAIGSVIEWCARAEDRGVRWTVLDAVVYERRIHSRNSSATHPQAAQEYARVLKCILERRRCRSLPAHATSTLTDAIQSEVTRHG